jgi:hypothetical protein
VSGLGRVLAGVDQVGIRHEPGCIRTQPFARGRKAIEPTDGPNGDQVYECECGAYSRWRDGELLDPWIGTLELAGGFYRIAPGWTEDEIIDDLHRSYQKQGGLSKRDERVFREQLRAVLTSDGQTGADSLPADLSPIVRAGDRDESGSLPGGLSWEGIQNAYRQLAGATPGIKFRRRSPDEPSREEVASKLHVSASTLKRACDKAGKGTRWPPIGL